MGLYYNSFAAPKVPRGAWEHGRGCCQSSLKQPFLLSAVVLETFRASDSWKLESETLHDKESFRDFLLDYLTTPPEGPVEQKWEDLLYVRTDAGKPRQSWFDFCHLRMLLGE